jgi:hypothetical protein
MRSYEKYERWVTLAKGLAEKDIPKDDKKLMDEIHKVEKCINEVREEMDRHFKLAPQVKRYFDLLKSESENRRNPKYVEDALTGNLVVESLWVWLDFSKFEKRVYGDVAKFNYPLANLEDCLKVLELEAVHRGISAPEPRHLASARTDDGHPVKPREQERNPRGAGRPRDPAVKRRRRKMFEFLREDGVDSKREAEKLIMQLDFRERLYDYFDENSVLMVKSDKYKVKKWRELKEAEHTLQDLQMAPYLVKDMNRHWDRFWNYQD